MLTKNMVMVERERRVGVVNFILEVKMRLGVVWWGGMCV